MKDLIESLFPYAPREGQIELAERVFHAALNDKHLIVNAPTGFGKTLPALVGLLAALKNSNMQILYVVRTHREADEVVREMEKIFPLLSFDPPIVLELRGRQSFCLRKQEVPPSLTLDTFCSSFKSSCEFFKNLVSTSLNILEKNFILSSSVLVRLGKKFDICPYFYSRRIIPYSDILILPYPYLINRKLRQEILSLLNRRKKKGLVIDECVSSDAIVETKSSKIRAIDLYKLVVNSKERINVPFFDGAFLRKSLGVIAESYLTFGNKLTVELCGGKKLGVSPHTKLLKKFNDSMRWTEARFINEGDEILIKEDNSNKYCFDSVKRIQRKKKDLLFDFFVLPGHNYIANGIVVHNSHHFPYLIYNEQSKRINLIELKELLLFSRRYKLRVLENFITTILGIVKNEIKDSKEITLETFIWLIRNKLSEVSLDHYLSLVVNDMKSLSRVIIEKQIPIDNSFRSFTEFFNFFVSYKSHKNIFVFLSKEPEAFIEIIRPKIKEEASMLLKNFNFSIHISGTLEWADDYVLLLGLPKEKCDFFHVRPSSYGIIFLGILDALSTKFSERSEEMYSLAAEKIAKIINSMEGKVVVYVPSYEVLNSLLDKKFSDFVSKEVFYESKEMDSEEHNLLVKAFEESRQNSVLLAVLGGRAGEGINFEKHDVKNVIIFGVPFQEPDPRTERFLLTVEELVRGKGIDFTYVYPAIMKVSQALGRIIRSPNDFGVMVLIDKRYSEPRLFRVLPRWIRNQLKGVYSSEEKLIEDIKRFMNNI